MDGKVSNGKRMDIMDVVKGILIILVVLGHTNTPLTKWIYSFHMAAFFAISGFFWNSKYAENFKNIVVFIKKRVQRIYIPFVSVNVIFIILNNLLISIGFYTTDPHFAELTANWPVSQLGSLYSIREILVNCAKSFLLIGGHAPIVGVSWYLATLFIISIIHLLLEVVMRKRTVNQKAIVYAVVLIVCLIGSAFTTEIIKGISGGWIICRILPAYSAFLMGYLVKAILPMLEARLSRISKPIKLAAAAIPAAVGLIYVILEPGMVELSKGIIVNPLYFILGLLQGMFITVILATFLMRTKLGDVVKYLGRKSMSIMLFHVLSFKAVNALLILIYKLDPVYMASRPVIYDLPSYWSILYLLIGIAIPVGVDLIIDRIKLRHIKNRKVLEK